MSNSNHKSPVQIRGRGSNFDLAWAAGIVDADGCVTLLQRSCNKNLRQPVLSVSNTDIFILKEISRIFGGRIQKKIKSKAGHSDSYEWRLNGSIQVVRALKLLQPYMRHTNKLKRIDLIVSYWGDGLQKRGLKFTPDEFKKRIIVQDKIMEIGKKSGSRRRGSYKIPTVGL